MRPPFVSFSLSRTCARFSRSALFSSSVATSYHRSPGASRVIPGVSIKLELERPGDPPGGPPGACYALLNPDPRLGPLTQASPPPTCDRRSVGAYCNTPLRRHFANSIACGEGI